MQEAGTGFASKPQTDDAEPGDIALDSWVRYDDPEVRTFKLNAERQNGRAAMLGVTGCLIHELLGVDALYPTGGMSGAAPPTYAPRRLALLPIFPSPRAALRRSLDAFSSLDRSVF